MHIAGLGWFGLTWYWTSPVVVWSASFSAESGSIRFSVLSVLEYHDIGMSHSSMPLVAEVFPPSESSLAVESSQMSHSRTFSSVSHNNTIAPDFEGCFNTICVLKSWR